MQFQHFVIASSFDLFRDVIGVQFVGFGAGAGAVLKDEAVFEAAVTNQLHAFLEGFVGFPAEADDEVAGHGAARNDVIDACHHFAVVFDSVAAFHASEHFVAAGLGGHVQVFHDFRQVAYGLQQVGRHVSWEAGDKAYALDPADVVESFQQFGQADQSSVFCVFVAVDGLSQQRDFAHTLIGQQLCFLNDVFRRATLFRSAGCRHHAVGAEFVTADHDADKSLKRRRAHFGIAERIIALKAVGDLQP